MLNRVNRRVNAINPAALLFMLELRDFNLYTCHIFVAASKKQAVSRPWRRQWRLVSGHRQLTSAGERWILYGTCRLQCSAGTCWYSSSGLATSSSSSEREDRFTDYCQQSGEVGGQPGRTRKQRCTTLFHRQWQRPVENDRATAAWVIGVLGLSRNRGVRRSPTDAAVFQTSSDRKRYWHRLEWTRHPSTSVPGGLLCRILSISAFQGKTFIDCFHYNQWKQPSKIHNVAKSSTFCLSPTF